MQDFDNILTINIKYKIVNYLVYLILIHLFCK